MAGYTMGQADNIRRAISKKKQKVIEEERKVFVYGDPQQGIPGCMANGVSEKDAQSIYDEIVAFANYAFNKAHAVCYAVVSYQTAYLKCHYPRQYMAALMTSVLNDSMKVSGYIAECKELGIATLPPDINHSQDNFSVEGDAIRFGLGAVKNVGRGLIRNMVAKREEDGPFQSLEDFLKRMGEGELNRRSVENFIKCGAMDCFGHHRSELLAVYEAMMDSVAASRRKNVEGQLELFSMFSDQQTVSQVQIPSLPEVSKADLMLMEKETTGIYLSGHPMDDYRQILKNTKVIPIGALLDEESTYQDEQTVMVAGVVQSTKLKTTRNNTTMAYVTMEDDTASIEMIAFSRIIDEFGHELRENAPIVVTGRLSLRDDKDPQIIINQVRPMADFKPGNPLIPKEMLRQDQTLYLRLPTEEGTLFPKIRAILNMFPGKNQAVVYFADTKQRRGTRCALDREMLQELTEVLGQENVVVK